LREKSLGLPYKVKTENNNVKVLIMYRFACKIIPNETKYTEAQLLEEIHKIVYKYGRVIPKETIYIITLDTENRIIYEDKYEKIRKTLVEMYIEEKIKKFSISALG
tara:strand:- start:223 stop:540 length:318 start_codon:yes stop_codon:yes gene_type:complete